MVFTCSTCINTLPLRKWSMAMAACTAYYHWDDKHPLTKCSKYRKRRAVKVNGTSSQVMDWLIDQRGHIDIPWQVVPHGHGEEHKCERERASELDSVLGARPSAGRAPLEHRLWEWCIMGVGCRRGQEVMYGDFGGVEVRCHVRLAGFTCSQTSWKTIKRWRCCQWLFHGLGYTCKGVYHLWECTTCLSGEIHPVRFRTYILLSAWDNELNILRVYSLKQSRQRHTCNWAFPLLTLQRKRPKESSIQVTLLLWNPVHRYNSAIIQ